MEISFEFSKHVGPRFIQGAVRLEFDSSKPYSFHSKADWPAGHDFTGAVREGVEAALLERLGSLSSVAVVLKSVTLHPVDSCEEGFRRAARAATEAAFAV